MMRRTAVVLLAGTLAGCGADDDADAGMPADASVAWQECTNERGFVASYPATWVTNDGSVTLACSLFHPEPFMVPEGSEIPEDIAVSMHVEYMAFDDVAGSDFGIRTLQREDTVVAGRRAVRRLVEHTGDGLYNRGLRTYAWFVEWGDGSTFIASSHDAGEPPFGEKRRVLDAMMGRLRLAH